MAVKTRAQIAAEIAALFADNTTGDISATDLRTVCNDLNDSANYEGKKVYKALLTQTGTNAPVATILENTLSGTPVWSYVGVGIYDLTLTGEFLENKTFVMTNSPNVAYTANGFVSVAYGSIDFIEIITANVSGVNENDLLSQNSITIEVYP